MSETPPQTCPKCYAPAEVLDTRGKHRRRKCLECNHRFSTVEIPAEQYERMKEAARRMKLFVASYQSLEELTSCGEIADLIDSLPKD
jgi:hypothetical protein